MPPDPAGRRTRRPPARGVAVVRRAGTVYVCAPSTEVAPAAFARVVLAVAGMLTGMVGGGLLFGQAVVYWLGV